jgi:type IV pilus assembly protein PilZ
LIELRRFIRTPVDAPAALVPKGGAQAIAGRARDISVGGMFIETAHVVPFGTDVTVRMRLPQGKEELALPGVVRWVRTDGMGIQFGLLGAKETHEITEIVRRGEVR